MMKLVVLVLCSLAACSRVEGIDLLHDLATAGENLLTGTVNGITHAATSGGITSIITSLFGRRDTQNGIAQTLQLAVSQAKSVIENYSQKAKQAYSEFQKVKGDAQKFEKVLQNLKHNQNLDLFKIINNVGAAVDSLSHGKRNVVDDITAFLQETIEHLKHPEDLLQEHLLAQLHNPLHHYQTPRTYQKRTLFLLQSLLNKLLPSTAASGSGTTPNNNNDNNNNNNVNTNINTNTNVNPTAAGTANNFQVDLTQLLQLLQQQQQQEGR